MQIIMKIKRQENQLLVIFSLMEIIQFLGNHNYKNVQLCQQ